MIKLSASNGKLSYSMTPDERITSGMVGKEIQVDLNPKLDDMISVAVCKGSGTTKDVTIEDGSFVLPWECVATPGGRLVIGVYGYTEEDGVKTIAIPTVYADLGIIYKGADPSNDPSADASASLWQQALSQIAGKANAVHTHAQTDITGLETALSGKAPTVHTHAQSDVAGLSPALANKANATHTHAQTDITGLTTALSGKASATHTHTISDIDTLDGILDGHADLIADLQTDKQDKLTAGQNITITNNVISASGGSGSSSWDSITGKPSTFPPSAHEHGIADITDMPSIPTDTLELTNGAGYITADDVPVTDVKINGTSVVANGVASIPKAGNLQLGVVGIPKQNTADCVFYIDTDGYLKPYSPTETNLANRASDRLLRASHIDKVVKQGMCYGIGDWTETEQAAARARLGISIWDGSVSE